MKKTRKKRTAKQRQENPAGNEDTTRHFSTLKKRELFLKAFGELGLVTQAAAKAGIHRSLHYQWLEVDEDYKKAFEDAKEVHIEKLEEEADRRAVEGVDEPVGFHKGMPWGMVKRYSDNLLMFRLKALRPDKYRDNQTVKHEGGTVIVKTNVDPFAGRKR